MRLLIVHRVRLICELMVTALRGQGRIEVVHIARSQEEALEKMANDAYDVVLVNINLPEQGALSLTRTLVRRKATAKIIITGLMQSKAAVLCCVEEGAAGYILEEESFADLLQKLQLVSTNQFPVTPNMSSVMIAQVAELKRKLTEIRKIAAVDTLDQREELTSREWQVLKLIARGASNQQIANHLVIELGTVKNHVHNILGKLEVESRKHAVLFARQLVIKEAMTHHHQLLVHGDQLRSPHAAQTPALL